MFKSLFSLTSFILGIFNLLFWGIAGWCGLVVSALWAIQLCLGYASVMELKHYTDNDLRLVVWIYTLSIMCLCVEYKKWKNLIAYTVSLLFFTVLTSGLEVEIKFFIQIFTAVGVGLGTRVVLDMKNGLSANMSKYVHMLFWYGVCATLFKAVSGGPLNEFLTLFFMTVFMLVWVFRFPYKTKFNQYY